MNIYAGFLAVFLMFMSTILLYITNHDIAGTMMTLFSALASMMMGVALAKGS